MYVLSGHEMDVVAEEVAVPDDQGNLGTCVRFATAKAVVNGHETRKYFTESIDFKQKEVSQVLLNEYKVVKHIFC